MKPEDVIHMGWVYKQSDFLKRWRKRFMVVTKTTIATYDSEDSSKTPTCTMFVKYCREVKADEESTHKKFGFSINYDGKKFLFYVESEKEHTEWLTKIGGIISEKHRY